KKKPTLFCGNLSVLCHFFKVNSKPKNQRARLPLLRLAGKAVPPFQQQKNDTPLFFVSFKS
ncbi:hypothetical protein, partial [Staphylococcus hominis]|uniref:hypothetical protein n=1 Tax=Staphylococcus hominis TaxID=1290 RepID=UPI001C9302CE